jgi:hypothetical protein
MNTLYDFTTHIKGVEYLMALGFIAMFLILNEVLKPKPFGGLIGLIIEERAIGFKTTAKSIGRLVTAPFIGLAYIVALPFAFVFALATAIGKSAAPAFSFGWRPVEAYLSGRKKKKAKK